MSFNTETNQILQAGSAQNATGLHLLACDEIFSFRALHVATPLRYYRIPRHSQSFRLLTSRAKLDL